MAGSYTALDTANGIRTTKEMYIGDAKTPDHLATEILDNMLDETSNGYGNSGSITFQNGECWITDNGRGFHVYQMPIPEGGTEDSVVVLCTRNHSGSKFEKKDYKYGIGMHGVGLVVTNALSDWLVIRTRDRENRNKVHNYTFIEFKLSEYKITEEQDDKSWSTIVGFKPTPKYFESVNFDEKGFAQRLLLCQAKIPNCNYYFNGKPIPKFSFDELVRKYLTLPNETNLFKFQNETESGVITGFLTYVNDQNSIILGDVNLRNCSGKYLDYFQKILNELIITKLDKKFKDVSPNLFSLGLRLYISLNMKRAKFDSQTKSRMLLSASDIIDSITSQIEWILKRPGIIDTIQSNLELKLNKNITKIKGNKRNVIDNDSKLRDAEKIPAKTLYILEGESALGTLNMVRNVTTDGIFPLRGKGLNVETATFDKIQNNKEIKWLKQALGSKESRRYSNIKILADADSDGWHIAVLTLLMLQMFASDYLEKGNISIVLPPLYGAQKKSSWIPIYKHGDVDQYRKQGYIITRFKGLGEMDPEHLDIALQSGMEYQVQVPETEAQKKALISMITDSDIKRRLLSDGRCTFDKLLAEVLKQKDQTLN